MHAALLGIGIALVTILVLSPLKKPGKKIMYSLVLTGIAFLYVGYTWMDLPALSINIVQAVCMSFLAYFGITRNFKWTIAGYFLHGLWDLLYGVFADPSLIPPDYDWFCLIIDFLMGIYLLILFPPSGWKADAGHA